MNLDLGGTIWLDVSRKLLSFHKWFFSRFEDMPKEVYEEFRHHSHTHPNVTIDTSTDGHAHYFYVDMMDCDNPNHYEHTHPMEYPTADSHAHSVTLSFAAADLGVPNWWNHVHAISVVSFGDAGASHRHTDPTQTFPYGCGYEIGRVYCAANPHIHDCTSFNMAAGAAHSHTVGSYNTETAYVGDTALNHRHPFDFYSDLGGAHQHDLIGMSVSFTTCFYGYNHEHGIPYPTTTPSVSHKHKLIGDSGYGGEAPPPPALRAGLHPAKVLAILLDD